MILFQFLIGRLEIKISQQAVVATITVFQFLIGRLEMNAGRMGLPVPNICFNSL